MFYTKSERGNIAGSLSAWRTLVFGAHNLSAMKSWRVGLHVGTGPQLIADICPSRL
jgi:hypothetical protein